MIFKRIIISISIISFSILTYPQSDIERATKEVDRSLDREIEKKLRVLPKKIPEIQEEVKEKEAKGETFFVKRIDLIGMESFTIEDFKSILQRYEDREVSVEELEILTKKIEREYLRKGVVAACFIPPQEIEEGIVILQVVEAKMGELKIKDHTHFGPERIVYYWQLNPDEILRYDKISRSLQMMNKNPDREVKAALYAGEKPQTTDIALDVKTAFPIHLTASFDREGGTSTGVKRRGIGLRHNNFLGFDDTLLVGYSFGEDYTGRYVFHSVPVSSFGTSLLYGYSYSKSFPKKELEPFLVDSRSRNTSISLHQDLFKEDEYIGEISFGLDIKDKTIIRDTGTLNKDRLRILRFGSNSLYRGFGSITRVNSELSQGINLFGARRKNPLSSREAKNTFTKANIEVTHKRMLPLKLQAALRFVGQLSSTKLVPQEEMSLGGINSVRGYPAADYLADTALQTNLELLIPAFFIPTKLKVPYATRPLKDDLTAVLFLDYAYGKRRGPSSEDKETVNLKSIGAGLRLRLFDQALLRLEWGFPIGDETTNEEASSRFHIALDFEDRLPAEIERIRQLVEKQNIRKWVWNILNEELQKPDSILRKKLFAYMHKAEKAYDQDNLEQSQEYYEKVYHTGNFLLEQTENYVRNCVELRKKLKEYNQLALKYYNQGNLEIAQEYWQKIIDEAEIEPLILEF